MGHLWARHSAGKAHSTGQIMACCFFSQVCCFAFAQVDSYEAPRYRGMLDCGRQVRQNHCWGRRNGASWVWRRRRMGLPALPLSAPRLLFAWCRCVCVCVGGCVCVCECVLGWKAKASRCGLCLCRESNAIASERWPTANVRRSLRVKAYAACGGALGRRWRAASPQMPRALLFMKPAASGWAACWARASTSVAYAMRKRASVSKRRTCAARPVAAVGSGQLTPKVCCPDTKQ
jgi:hypothetical protein